MITLRRACRNVHVVPEVVAVWKSARTYHGLAVSRIVASRSRYVAGPPSLLTLAPWSSSLIERSKPTHNAPCVPHPLDAPDWGGDAYEDPLFYRLKSSTSHRGSQLFWRMRVKRCKTETDNGKLTAPSLARTILSPQVAGCCVRALSFPIRPYATESVHRLFA
jgi:hypothetical protein